MNRAARILGRIAAIGLAAAVFIGLAATYDRSLRPAHGEAEARMERALRRRPPVPQWRGLLGFAGEFVLFAGIAAAGRKVLRLRLR